VTRWGCGCEVHPRKIAPSRDVAPALGSHLGSTGRVNHPPEQTAVRRRLPARIGYAGVRLNYHAPEPLTRAVACARTRFSRKAAIHPLGAALSFKADDPVDAALQGAFLAAISLKFDDQLSSKPRPRR
jgi:hypothetical protein